MNDNMYVTIAMHFALRVNISLQILSTPIPLT